MTPPRKAPRWFLAATLAAGCVTGCMTQEKVEDEIAAANHCVAPEDCVDVGSHCPFGCYILVNEAEADRIEDLIQDYDDAHPGEQCLYDCIAVAGFDCQAGRCVTVEATEL